MVFRLERHMAIRHSYKMGNYLKRNLSQMIVIFSDEIPW